MNLKFQITDRKPLPMIPSASGVEFNDGKLYIIGDNAHYIGIYELDLSTFSLVPYEYPFLPGDTIPKKLKCDAEATTISTHTGRKQLYIFGSGSASPQRDKLVQMDLRTDHAASDPITITPFYNLLRAKTESLNIEAAVSLNYDFILFNRHDNQIFRFSADEFDRYVKDSSSYIEISSHFISIPKYDSLYVGFSGATLIPGTSLVLYTATVELTDNWIDDGKILGSFLGLIDFKNPKNPQCVAQIPIAQKNKILPIKVESVTLESTSGNKASIIMVTDPDGATSEVIFAKIQW